jgi:hypothetical protein
MLPYICAFAVFIVVSFALGMVVGTLLVVYETNQERS